MYTIADGDINMDEAAALAVRHARSLDAYLSSKPVAAHTRVAYDEAHAWVLAFHERRAAAAAAGDLRVVPYWLPSSDGARANAPPLPVILDSGCGTGTSTAAIARCYPHLPVLGIDRSAHRLSKRGSSSQRQPPRTTSRGVGGESQSESESESASESASESDRDGTAAAHDHTASGGDARGGEGGGWPRNAFLVRAELADFWRVAAVHAGATCGASSDSGAGVLAHRSELDARLGPALTVQRHFVLYPNPNPKRATRQRRWHLHPSLPLLLGLGGHLVLRSNWRGYLDEVRARVVCVCKTGGEGGRCCLFIR